MTRTQQSAYTRSIGLHLALAATIVAAALWTRGERPAAQRICELIPTTGTSSVTGMAAPLRQEPTVRVQIPRVAPERVSTASAPATPASAVAAAPHPARPRVSVNSPATAPRAVAGPSKPWIDPRPIEDALQSAGRPSEQVSPGQADALAAYFDSLAREVKSHHVAPEGLAGGLVCRVSFFVAADGTLLHVRMIRSSGDSAFDQSVLEAFHASHGIGPRPDHVGSEQVVNFREVD